MPIYEYRCESCGHELDVLQKVSDDPLRDCPDCDAPALRRLISAPAFRLKGDGWYETDFKSDKETKRNLVEPPAEAKAEEKAKAGEKSSGEKSSRKTEGSDSKSSAGSGSRSSSDSKSKGSGSAAA